MEGPELTDVQRQNMLLREMIEELKKMNGGVAVDNIDIPFWRMVKLIIKWAFATVVAMIPFFLIGTVITIILQVMLIIFGAGLLQ